MLKTLLSAAALVVLAPMPAHAVVVLSGSGTLASTDPTQTGRVSRDAIPSTWAAQKAYPGTIAGTYVYDLVNGTFASNALQAIYYEITVTAPSTTVSQPFVVAYRNSFNPASISTNYLGDSGSSAGGDNAGIPVTFQVIVAAGSQLLVNFSEVSNNNLPTTYTYRISAFSDANRGENFLPVNGAVPEPATWAMMMLGFGSVGFAMRRNKAGTRVRFA